MRNSVQPGATEIHSINTDAQDLNASCNDMWQQLLDESLDNKVRVIHIEQEDNCCRIRKRAGGLLSEIRIDSATFAVELRSYLEQILTEAKKTDSSLTTKLFHRQIECNIECRWYQALRGEVLVIRIYHDRNIPESLEQTTLDPDALQTLRYGLLHNNGGVTIICCRSSDLLCDLYYSLLGELTQFDQKVVSFEATPRKSIARINQIISSGDVFAIDDASHVFIDWIEARKAQLIGNLFCNYPNATVFVNAHSLPEAIRQLTDLSGNERQLATNAAILVEIDRVRLICPHCASAHQPGKFEIRLMTECGIGVNSTLNYASGCESCDYTGFGDEKSLVALYQCNDLLRNKIESRNKEAIDSALANNNVTSIKDQKRSLICTGEVEFRPASND